MYLYVRGFNFTSTICLLDFGTIPTVWYFLFFILFYLYQSINIIEFFYRSGDEGIYPEMETVCEERIEKLNPKRYSTIYRHVITISF